MQQEINSAGNVFEIGLPPWFEPKEEIDIENIQSIHLDTIIDQAFALIAGELNNYQLRDDQIGMSKQVLKGLYYNKSVVAEAGTGIGKSFAYMVAAISFSYLTGQRVLITTETKNLQL